MVVLVIAIPLTALPANTSATHFSGSSLSSIDAPPAPSGIVAEVDPDRLFLSLEVGSVRVASWAALAARSMLAGSLTKSDWIDASADAAAVIADSRLERG